ncbi:LysR family transcriptional regulator [Streptomyces bathyalis]|uniref:LysR family transcriptional regulator n=1 Tax=Streptomyces bathyalis TaxID=2710756 RepID=A0A7T1WW50_9ACTN|nr:LysR family transcriptional regulator [Streptomyces bathyalis]QPP10932.1 LysR family transcriptional regulator [Streptomyces bathyalis]
MLRRVELEVRHLRALCAIADTGSVHKAARQLGMTQPSLTTQLRRIEQAVGGQLFARERTGSVPTPLGRFVLCRARPLVAEMTALVSEARAAANRAGGEYLRIGSTGSPAVPGWLRRLRARFPEADTTFHMDASAQTLLRMVVANQLDAVFVHEVEGSPLQIPDGLEMYVLVEREPQFVALSATHPLASRAVLSLGELADERWMVDPAADGEWTGLRRVFTEAGINPRVVHGDNLAAADLVAAGEVVAPCQPTAPARPGRIVRPLLGDPLAVRLLLATRGTASGGDPGTAPVIEPAALLADLQASYREVAWASDTYRYWYQQHDGGQSLPFTVVA